MRSKNLKTFATIINSESAKDADLKVIVFKTIYDIDVSMSKLKFLFSSEFLFEESQHNHLSISQNFLGRNLFYSSIFALLCSTVVPYIQKIETMNHNGTFRKLKGHESSPRIFYNKFRAIINRNSLKNFFVIVLSIII